MAKSGLFQRRLYRMLVLGFFLFYAHNGFGAQGGESRFRQGEAFSDPSYIVNMPEEWCKRPLKKVPDTVIVNLDQQMYKVLHTPLQYYGARKGLHLTITNSTCGNSSGLLLHKGIDIGGFCCPIGATDRLPGLLFHTTAITPNAVLVHPDNPIKSITLNEARRIFAGEILRWSELKRPDGSPGDDAEILPIARLHCKARPGHWRLLLDNEDLFSPKMIEAGKMEDMVYLVATKKYAIGFDALWMTKELEDKKGRVKALLIDGVSPYDLDALVAGEYPFYKVFSTTTWQGEEVRNNEAGKLVQFISQQVEHVDPSLLMIPIKRLQTHGWQFNGDELVGEPL